MGWTQSSATTQIGGRKGKEKIRVALLRNIKEGKSYQQMNAEAQQHRVDWTTSS